MRSAQSLGGMTNHIATIEESRDAFRLASDILMDLHGGMQVHQTFQKLFRVNPPNQPMQTQVNRICAFQAVIALYKWVEFYDRYSRAIPSDTRVIAKRLKKDIEERGIPKFRDQVVGHIWSKETGRPLTAAEVERRFAQVAPAGMEAFMAWVCNAEGPASVSTAAGAVERVRDAICATNGFSDADLRE